MPLPRRGCGVGDQLAAPSLTEHGKHALALAPNRFPPLLGDPVVLPPLILVRSREIGRIHDPALLHQPLERGIEASRTDGDAAAALPIDLAKERIPVIVALSEGDEDGHGERAQRFGDRWGAVRHGAGLGFRRSFRTRGSEISSGDDRQPSKSLPTRTISMIGRVGGGVGCVNSGGWLILPWTRLVRPIIFPGFRVGGGRAGMASESQKS